MGGKTSTSGSYGGDDRGRDRNDRSTQAEITGGTKKVKEAIKKSGSNMYGDTASQATNEYLVDIGEATRGNPYKDAQGNITGYSYNLTGKGHELKYGSYNPGGTQNPTAMGTVGSAGIMNQIPISEAMFESQRKTKMLATGALSLFAPFPVSTVLGYASNQARKEQYSNYVSSFNDSMSSTSYAASSTQNKFNDSSAKTDSAGTDTTGTNSDNKVQTDKEEQRRLALARKNSAITGSRKLFNTTNKTITGAMV